MEGKPVIMGKSESLSSISIGHQKLKNGRESAVNKVLDGSTYLS
jgi:hypothetical protein